MMATDIISVFFSALLILQTWTFCASVKSQKGLVITKLPLYDEDTFLNIIKDNKSEHFNLSTATTIAQALTTPYETEFHSCDADYALGAIFVHDLNRNAIYRVGNYSIEVENVLTYSPLHKGVSGKHVSIAVDWKSHNVYWSNFNQNWIAVKPAMSPDSSLYAVVVQGSGVRPKQIAVDPKNGFLFYADHGNQKSIKKASLTGKNQTTIVNTGIGNIRAMHVDAKDKRVFWSDEERHSIESCGYDGSERQHFLSSEQYIFADLAVLDDDLILLPDAFLSASSDNTFLVYDMDSASEISTLYSPDIFLSMCNWDSDLQPKLEEELQCKSALCEHICVIEPASTPCLCKEGYLLADDGHSCIEHTGVFHRGVVVTNGSSVCWADIRIFSHNGFTPECFYHLGKTNTDKILYVDIDTNDGRLFLAMESNTIVVLSLNDLSKAQYFTVSGNVTGIKYDLESENLYWSAGGDSGSIWVRRGTEIGRLFPSDTDNGTIVQPQNVIIVSQHGKLMWISGTEYDYRIESANLIGENRTTIVDSYTLDNPTSLLYHSNTDRIYWIDRSYGTTYLYTANVDGSDIDIEATIDGVSLILFYKSFVFYTKDTAAGSEYEVLDLEDLYGDTLTEGDFQSIGNITSLVIVDQSQRQQRTDACSTLNGGCEHICIASGDGRRCLCKLGFQLHTDGASCRSNPLRNNFLLVTDDSHSALYQISLEDTSDIQAVTVSPGTIPQSAVYMPEAESFLWTTFDDYDSFIKLSDFNGSETVIIAQDGNHNPFRIQIDYTTNTFFFAEHLYESSVTPRDSIFAANLAGEIYTIQNNLTGLADFVIDPKEGFLFWSANGPSGAHIGRINMDSSGVRLIVTYKLSLPRGLAIDYKENTIYFVNGFWATIESCDYFGFNRNIIVQENPAVVTDITYNDGYIYYIASNKPNIHRFGVNNDTDVFSIVHADLGRITSLYVFVGSLSRVNAYCGDGRGGCSSFCLPNGAAGVCGCPDNVLFEPNSFTECMNVTTCPGQISGVKVKATCLRRNGSECMFQCDSNSRPNLLTCRNRTWDMDTPCIGQTNNKTSEVSGTTTSVQKGTAPVIEATTQISDSTKITESLTTKVPEDTTTMFEEYQPSYQVHLRDVVGGISGGVAFLIVGAIIVFCSIRRGRKKSKADDLSISLQDRRKGSADDHHSEYDWPYGMARSPQFAEIQMPSPFYQIPSGGPRGRSNLSLY